jgi:hypothetical protein
MYIPCPTISTPVQGTEELDKDNWEANNCSACACICLTLDNDELDHTRALKTTNDMYRVLAKWHLKGTNITEHQLWDKMFNISIDCSSSTQMFGTLAEVPSLTDQIWHLMDGKDLTKDDAFKVFMLHSLTGTEGHVCCHTLLNKVAKGALTHSTLETSWTG